MCVTSVSDRRLADGLRALVLALVAGPTLADRISKGPIPLDEALPIAKQIAEALEAAHEAGVIHWALKPANIKVREDGTVKETRCEHCVAGTQCTLAGPKASMLFVKENV